MKKKILAGFVLIIMTILIVNPAHTQEIVSVTPNNGYVGQTAYLVIVCTNTQLMTGFSSIEIGDPSQIQVISATVKNNYELEVIINILPNAQPDEYQDIIIYLSNGGIIQKENAFLTKATGDFDVMLTVIHVDPLYLSAFDPDQPQNSPLLFNVQLMNEWKVLDNLRVEFIVENPDYGELATANKFFTDDIQPGLPYVVFDNREFDEYSINSDALDLIDDAMQTGLLPAGQYIYYINVYAGDSLIGQDQGANVTSNILTSIELIGPGNSLDMSPETIFTPTPYFQWFSAASTYDFTLYEVMDGQTSPDEITSNLPVYEVSDMGIAELLYPTFAELLVEGKTYAWQVKAHFDGSMGQEVIYSDVFWFVYQGGGNLIYDHIEVKPGGSIVIVDESAQYFALGYEFNNILPDTLNPVWQVVPSSAGTIDVNGLFTAGETPGIAAVVASWDGLQEYTTVLISEIAPQDYEFGIEKLFKDLFCLKQVKNSEKACEYYMFISKQTNEYWPNYKGLGTKTTDRYEHGCVKISNEGPILYGVLPNDKCIGTNTTKFWEGWVHPDVPEGPPPGESENASLIFDYDVHYSRPVEFSGGVNFQCGAIYLEEPEGGYDCTNCPFHSNGGHHVLIHKTGAITANFTVYSINIEVPNVCAEVGKPITITAETYPSDMGEVTWETQGNDIIIDADNRNATITGNKPGVYTIIAKLNINDVTYKTEFTVTICEVDLETDGPLGMRIGGRFIAFQTFKAKVLPEGTKANISVRLGDVELSKAIVSNGDRVTVKMKDDTRYGLRITHDCNDSIFKDVGEKLSVKITKAVLSVNKKNGLLTINCSAEGSPKGGVYKWNINGRIINGKDPELKFNVTQWDFKNGQDIPINVTYFVLGVNISASTVLKAPSIMSVKIINAEGHSKRRTKSVTVNCEAKGLPEGGVYMWTIGDKKRIGGKKVQVVLKDLEWNAITGIIPVKIEYTLKGKSVTAKTNIKVKPLKLRFRLYVKRKMLINPIRRKRLDAVFAPEGCEVTWSKVGGCIKLKEIVNHKTKSYYIFEATESGTAEITAYLHYRGKVVKVKSCKITVVE
jgi:hypothetical protein